MHTRYQTEMQCFLSRHAHSGDELRRIDLTDDVGKLRSRCEPFDVTLGSRPPADRDLTRRDGSDELAADARDRMKRIVVQRCVGMLDVRNLVIEKPSERSHQSAFSLSFLTKKQHVMPCDECDVDFRNDGVFIADDAGKEFLT